MRRTSSIRKNGPARRPLAGTTLALENFEEVSLEATREHRPVLHRTGTGSSAGSFSGPGLGLRVRPQQNRTFSHMADQSAKHESVDSLPEPLARSTTAPAQSMEARLRRLSSSSLPNSAEGEPTRRVKRSTSQFWLQRQAAREATHGFSSDESIPDDVELGNIPLSPALTDVAAQEAAIASGLPRSPSVQDVYMAALNSDTQKLTVDLSEHAEKSALEPTLVVPLNLHTGNKTKADRKASAKAAVSSLHPVVDRNIETLPISREKEALLTCTRPTFLPPKSKKEEKKHLKEYERLIRGSLEVERKMQRQKYKQLNSKAKHLTNSVEQWDKNILPHFETAIRDPRTRALWWSGIPTRVRGRVWQTCIGNALSVTPETFRVAFDKAVVLEARLNRPSSSASDADAQLLTSDHFKQARRAVMETFADLRIFQPGGPLHEALLQVLMAYLYYRQDVGFVMGSNYIAGLLLLNLPPAQSFVALVNLLNRSLPLALYTRDEAVLNRFLATFLKHFQEKLPDLFRHLHHELQLSPTRYLLPMLYSLFAEQAPVDVSSRIFDIYLFEGDLFLMRSALGVLVQLEHTLYGSADEVLAVLTGQGKEKETWRRNLDDEDRFIEVVRFVWR